MPTFKILTRRSSRDETTNVNFFYDDILHVLRNNNTYCTLSAKVYKNFIMVKSDMQLNLKVAMTSLSNIVMMAAGHMRPPMHNSFVPGNLREYRNKYSAVESVGVSATTFT